MLAFNDRLTSLQNTRKKFESIRDRLAEALYQKGLALTEIESLKVRAFTLFLINIIIIATFCGFSLLIIWLFRQQDRNLA